MLLLSLTQVHAIGKTHGITRAELAAQKKHLRSSLTNYLSRDQHIHDIVDDTEEAKKMIAFARAQGSRFDDIVLLGIGGSALGAICLRDALTHLFGYSKKKTPRLHVLDNIDPTLLTEVQDVITLKRTLFLVISKSGNSPEPVSQFLFFKKKLTAAGLLAKDHMVCITNPDTGFLRNIAQQEGIPTFDHAPVGGRWSVLSSVGLLPAAFLGIDILGLLRGARTMRDQFLSTSWTQNLPFQLASTQFLLHQKGIRMTVMMPYAQKLIRFADWYRQLLAESIGKEKDRDGKIVHAGITPIQALGTTDQHSQSQLYNEGPNDKLIIFVEVQKHGSRQNIPSLYPKESAIAYLKGASFNDLIHAEKEGTAAALTKRKRPNITITLDSLDAVHLGQLLFLCEGATAFLGELFNVDAYNQPGVELAKELTKTYLKKN